MCREAGMPFLWFHVIPISQITKSPGNQEGNTGWEGPGWCTSSTIPSPWYHLQVSFPDRPSTLTCPTITAVAIPGPKRSLWMSRDCWQASYGLLMVSCRVRDGVQWLWVWGWVGEQWVWLWVHSLCWVCITFICSTFSDVSTFCTDWGDSQGSTKINICREHKRGWVSSRKSVHGIKQDHDPPLPSCP